MRRAGRTLVFEPIQSATDVRPANKSAVETSRVARTASRGTAQLSMSADSRARRASFDRGSLRSRRAMHWCSARGGIMPW